MRYVDGRWGRTYFIGKDQYVGASLFHYGEYGPEETEKILSLANGLCLDIGANFGCIGQALEYSGFKTICFEPQPWVYDVLVKNVSDARNIALGAGFGTAKMPRLLAGQKANYGGMGIGMRSDLGTIDVSVVPLDSLELKDVGFIKIDVEGYELEVLKGAADTISRCNPIMYIEDDRLEKSAALRKFIASLGYKIEEHKPLLYRENNYFGLKRNIWDKLYASHNLICSK